MLNPRDNLRLALTKLRTRRIRLGITLLISGLLFAALIAVSLIVRGTISGITDFTKEAFLNRFISVVFISPGNEAMSYNAPLQEEKYLKRAKELFAVQLTKMSAEAKRVGLPFDASQVAKPYTEDHSGPDANKTYQTLDLNQPAAQQAVAELGAPPSQQSEVKQLTAPYRTIGYYSSDVLASGASGMTFSLTPIVKGKEVADEASTTKPMTGPPDPLKSFATSINVSDDKLAEPFILRGVNIVAKPGEPVPILAPAAAAEQLTGLAALPAKATNQQKLDHLVKLRNQANGFTFDVCYRNSTAVEQLNTAINQAAEIKAHAGDKSYTPPAVIYGQASQACRPVVITKDSRSAEDKALSVKQTAFDEQFTKPAPVITPITFRIIGLLPQPNYSDSGINIEAFVSSMLSPTIGSGWSIPRSAISNSATLKQIVDNPVNKMMNYGTYYVEFADRDAQKRFLEEKTCTPNDSNNWCGNKGSVQTFAYGNPIASLYDGLKQAQTVIIWILSTIAAISAVIMMGTIGKVIADSRKETSVFRALGARRLQIAQIYLLYGTLLGVMVFGMALLIGGGVAIWAEAANSGAISVAAVLAFNAADVHKAFHVIGWSWLDMGAIALMVVASALIATILPLLTNIRRNPVKDMREE